MTILPDREAQSALLFQRVRDYDLGDLPESEIPPLERGGFQPHMDIVKTNIAKYSDEFINRLCEATTDTTSSATEKLLKNVLYQSATPEKYDFQRDRLSTKNSSPIYAHEVLGGLLHYTRSSPVDHSTNHSPLTTEQVTALTIVTARLQDAKHATSEHDTHDLFSNDGYARWIPVIPFMGCTVIVDHTLARFIIEHTAKAEHIADTILRRNTVDTDTIHTVITTEALSLSNGYI
jgi:hypothetical protein